MVWRAAPWDANHPEVRDTFRALCGAVLDTARVGRIIPGFPDLIVPYRGRWHFVEVKVGKGKLRRSQMLFRLLFPNGCHHTARSADAAIALVEAWRVLGGDPCPVEP